MRVQIGLGDSGFYLLPQGLVYRMAPEPPILGGMPMGPMIFLELSGVSRLLFCARLQRLFNMRALAHFGTRWVLNKYQLFISFSFGPLGWGYTSASRVSWYTDQVGCFLAFVASRSRLPDISSREAWHSSHVA